MLKKKFNESFRIEIIYINSQGLNHGFSTCNKYFSSYINQSNLNLNMHRSVYQQIMTP
jgi:hypothetical protein